MAATARTTASLNEQMREAVRNCLAQASPRVIAAYQFGSTVRQQATPLSDVDVAVYLDEPSRETRAMAYPTLRDCLQQAIDAMPVDLVLLNDASPALAIRAIDGVLLYVSDERRRIALETAILPPEPARSVAVSPQ
ncbi:MAG: nucleotidyltransferase domain-containing protein [Chloroflexi bacterium]|nr:nucleotidyltransferase domain-containing protein [Chloroflexota bacterium]